MFALISEGPLSSLKQDFIGNDGRGRRRESRRRGEAVREKAGYFEVILLNSLLNLTRAGESRAIPKYGKRVTKW